MPLSTFRPFAVVACALVGLPVARAAAQQLPAPAAARPRYAASLVAGASQFDLSGTGTTALLGIRVEAELRRWLVVEGALGTFRPEEQFGRRARYVVPEAQLQLQIPGRVVRPYLGAGGGYVFAGGGWQTTGTVSGAAGLRVGLPGGRVDARGELRARGIGRSFSGSTAEWTAGLAYRF